MNKKNALSIQSKNIFTRRAAIRIGRAAREIVGGGIEATRAEELINILEECGSTGVRGEELNV
jgi:hypothetical protein